MKFILEIELGNDAMRRVGDVSILLEHTARNMRSRWDDNDRFLSDAQSIVRDLNGNTVGKWEVIEQ